MVRKNAITDPDEIRKLVAQHGRWWHEIELAPGIVTPGDDSNRMRLPILEELGLGSDLRGQRALDIGCSDGYFSFELENRGAEVVAMDFVPEHYTGFAVAKEILESSVAYSMDNVYNLHPREYGHFDIVLFPGVLYHLRKPMAALDAIRSVMKPGADLFVATFLIDEHVILPDRSVTTLKELNPLLLDIPLWQAYPGDVLNGDFTNQFAPNMCALKAALNEAQFSVVCTKCLPGGGFARAKATDDKLAAKYQVLDGRLDETPFDPSIPYYLDEEGSVHDLTGRRHDNRPNGARKTEVRPMSAARRVWNSLGRLRSRSLKGTTH